MTRKTILKEVDAERDRQDRMWGPAFDDKNTTNDWTTYLTIYAGKAAPLDKDDATSRAKLVQVAAIAVAAIEAHDRNKGFPKRHYDKASSQRKTK